MKLYLIRHAHTQIDRNEDAKAWALSDVGQQQATQLATLPFWNDVAGIVLSSEAKTRLTITPVLATRRIPIHVDTRLDELHRSGWMGTDAYAAHVRRVFAYPNQAAGEWESAADALTRVRAAIADFCQIYPNQTVALVGHGLTLSLYRAHLLGQSHVHFPDWQELSFAAVAVVDPQQETLLQNFQAIGT